MPRTDAASIPGVPRKILPYAWKPPADAAAPAKHSSYGCLTATVVWSLTCCGLFAFTTPFVLNIDL